MIGLLWKKVLNISLVTKMIKELDLDAYHLDGLMKIVLCIFWSKKRKHFDKYNEIWEKVSNIIKQIISELVYNKKYMKADNKINTKESFQWFYSPVLLISSVSRIDEIYYPEVFLEKSYKSYFEDFNEKLNI